MINWNVYSWLGRDEVRVGSNLSGNLEQLSLFINNLPAPEGAYGVRPEITDLRVVNEALTGPERTGRALRGFKLP